LPAVGRGRIGVVYGTQLLKRGAWQFRKPAQKFQPGRPKMTDENKSASNELVEVLRGEQQ